MVTYNKHFTFYILALMLLACPSLASTNIIWTQIIPRLIYSNALVSDVIFDLESKSKALDPQNRGIRIVYHKPPYGNDFTMSFNWENIALYQAVSVIAKSAMAQIYFADDVAILAERETEGIHQLRSTGIHGVISDAISGAPITNAQMITPQIDGSNYIQISSNGTFNAIVKYRVRRPWIYDLCIYEPEDDVVDVKIIAPDYTERRMSIPLDKIGVSSIEIKLYPFGAEVKQEVGTDGVTNKKQKF